MTACSYLESAMRCIQDDDVSLLQSIKQNCPVVMTSEYSVDLYCNYLWIHGTSWGWCTDQKKLDHFTDHFRSTYIYEGSNTDPVKVVGLWELLQCVKEVAPQLHAYRMSAE